jgi:hypothetical protein
MVIKISAERIAKILILTGVVLLALDLIVLIAHYDYGFQSSLVRGFSFGSERNFPTFYSALLFLFSAFLSLTISCPRPEEKKPLRAYWLLLTVIFLYCAFDELFEIHERLIVPFRNLLHAKGYLYFTWVVPFAALLAVFVLGYLRFLIALPRTTRWRLIASGAIYVLGALGMELVGAEYFSRQGGDNLKYTLMQTVEESLEMSGLILCAYTLLAHIRDHIGTLRVTIE